MRLDFPFPEVATGDFDIAVVGQLPAANLPFGNQFEPGSVEVVSFEAPFGRGGLRNQDLEDTSGNAHYALIFADADAERDDRALTVPACVGGKTKEHCNLLSGDIPFPYCSQRTIMVIAGSVEACERAGDGLPIRLG
jgi:hypothetical protein